MPTQIVDPNTPIQDAPGNVFAIEDARVVGAGGQPAYDGGWAAVAAAGGARFYKHLGVVRLGGAMTGLTGIEAFVLPVGYRPAHALHFRACAVNASDGSLDATHDAWITILANGNVVPSLDVGSGPVSLDGITFRAEQ